MYFLGRAAHALQDSFAHMIRSEQDDMRKVVHVLNYVDAIGTNFNEDRDGLAHSDSMDDCETNPGKNVEAAADATIELFYAWRGERTGLAPGAVVRVLDRWVTLKPGCTKENNFCENPDWLALVREHQTKPYLEAMLGCSATPRGNGSPALLLALLLVVLGARKRAFRGLVLGLVALTTLGCGLDKQRPSVFALSEAVVAEANALSNAFGFDGAESMPPVSATTGPGPVLDSVTSPLDFGFDSGFEIKLAAAAGSASAITHVVWQVEDASNSWKIPVTVGQDGVISVKGTLGQTAARRGWVRVFALDSNEVAGPPVRLAVNMVKEVSELRRRVVSLAAHQGAARAIEYSREPTERNWLVTGGHDALVALWDLTTGHRIRNYVGHSGPVIATAMTRNGARIASGGADHVVHVWDTESAELVKTLGGHTDAIQAVVLSADDQQLASGSWDASVRVYEASSGSLLQVLDAGAPVNDVIFDPTGQVIVAATGLLFDSGTVTLWKTSDWSVVASVEVPREVTALAFSPDGSRLAAAAGRGRIVVVKTADGSSLHEFVPPDTLDTKVKGIESKIPPRDTITALEFSANAPDRIGVVTLTGVLALWSQDKKTIVLNISTGEAAMDVAFSTGGNRLGLATESGAVRLFQVADP